MSLENPWSKAKNVFVLTIIVAITACLFCTCGTRDIIDSDTAIRQSNGSSESVTTAEQNPDATASSDVSDIETDERPDETFPATESSQNITMEEPAVEKKLSLTINGQSVSVKWEDNESVKALKNLVKDKPLTIQMSMYGGFEQVGSIGTSLPRNDSQTTTAAGDIVLYSGNQIVVFYGSNSWAYTRLGHITEKTPSQMKDLLGNGNVTLTIICE